MTPAREAEIRAYLVSVVSQVDTVWLGEVVAELEAVRAERDQGINELSYARSENWFSALRRCERDIDRAMERAARAEATLAAIRAWAERPDVPAWRDGVVILKDSYRMAAHDVLALLDAKEMT